ncbi:MAG: response regulator [Sedimenticola sp.]|nr:response regulator [Sedimenticola sp.]
MANILLVEDDPMISRMLSLRLQMKGHQVDLAENGKVGMEMALASSYDIVLMDMHMPVMDGHEATQALRDAGYTGLIVAVTASVMSKESEAAIKSGCDSYISKPVTETFEQEVQEKVDGHK